MKILVGLKGAGGQDFTHNEVTVSSTAPIEMSSGGKASKLPAGVILKFKGQDGCLSSNEGKLPGNVKEARLTSRAPFKIKLTNHSSLYDGVILLSVQSNKVLAKLELDLERYVQGVLRSEVPASYHVEAMRAQAILARTYALHPRLDHTPDNCNVCDSFLCCQAFNGVDPGLSAQQRQAISSTRSIVLSYEGKPALALFSACAGGHTDAYSNCFSDPITNQFPAPEIPYLVPVAEGKLPAGFPSEKTIEELYRDPHPDTIDGDAPQFRWQVKISANQLEAHMHHVLEEMAKEAQFKPFIKAGGERFGQIKRFTVSKRGPSGVAMELTIETSTGNWIVKKELAIRSAFANPELKLKRLRSGRFVVKHEFDNLGQLANVHILGLGSGHGVGLQQVGAQALASKGLSHQKILARYYPGTQLLKMP